MYPKVANDTQNAPNSTSHALVPPSGNSVPVFSLSSLPDLSGVSHAVRSDSCRTAILEMYENRQANLDIFQKGVVFELAKNSCLILFLRLNLYSIGPRIITPHFLNAKSSFSVYSIMLLITARKSRAAHGHSHFIVLVLAST